MNEFDRIHTFFKPLATHQGALGLLDDVALLSPKAGNQLVITNDAIVEGIHFIGDEPPALIAQKLLRVNLSDLAAKGATPLGYMLTLMLPESISNEWLKAFTRGLAEDQAHYGIALLGGDTVKTTGPLSLSVTAIGEVPNGAALLRSTARAGDAIVMTGNLGEGAAGLLASREKLAAISDIDAAYLVLRYRLPQPRLGAGLAMRGIATAGMDISDGLMQDLRHICNASNCGAMVAFEQLPLSVAMKKLYLSGDVSIEHIVAGGDDYELLFALPEEKIANLPELSKKAGASLSVIGRFTDSHADVRLYLNGRHVQLSKHGYSHF